MIYYYLFTIVAALLYCIHEKSGFVVAVLGIIIFLLILPSTQKDYEVYKNAFESAYWIGEYPWFRSRSSLFAEPFYKWYSSAIGVMLPFGFPFFLAFNFGLSILITLFIFRKTASRFKYIFWLMLMPTIIPTIYYWSPRSSMSFILVLGGMVALINKRYILSVVVMFMGLMIHSQYILMAAFIYLMYTLFLIVSNLNEKFRLPILVFAIAAMGLFLNNIESLLNQISFLFGALPSGEVASHKLKYFVKERHGFRLTGILSMIIYPALGFLLAMKIANSKQKYFSNDPKINTDFIYMLMSVMLLGAIVNISFIDHPHLAGRLSRFSDYLGMGLLIPAFMMIVVNKNMAKLSLIGLTLIAPLLYPNLYQYVNWSILF